MNTISHPFSRFCRLAFLAGLALAIPASGTAAATLLFSDTFESGNLTGSTGISNTWTTIANTDQTYEVQDTVALAGDYSFKATDASTSTIGQMVATFAHSSAYGDQLKAETLIRIDAMSQSLIVALRASAAYDGVTLRFLNSSGVYKLQYTADFGLSGVNWIDIQQISLSTTYKLRIEANFTTDLYDLFLDDVKVLSSAPVVSDLTGVDRMDFRAGNTSVGTSTFYIDNVFVNAIPEPGSVALFAGASLIALLKRRRRNSSAGA